VTAARVFEALFAAAVLVAALVLFGTAAGRLGRHAIVAATAMLGAAAVVGWVVFALDPDERVGIAAGGLTACALAAAAAAGRDRQRAARHGGAGCGRDAPARRGRARGGRRRRRA
jgi:hypothetical protein